MLTSSKYVLVLSDEGLNFYEVSSARTILVDSIPWDTEGFEDAAADTIGRKARGRSLILFNDMVEQHYRKEKIPKISILDRANVVERRLAAAFPSYPMRASLRLKGKGGLQKVDSGGEVYLFSAVPLSDNIRKTFAAIRRAHATISAFGLLPVESSSMVHLLSKKLTKGLDKQSVWTVFVGQHQSGGLRQVVTRNGELALTRMTPITDSDQDADSWASEVATEIKGTMSYLSRFGFDANDGLDIIVIASNAAAEYVASKIDFECNLNILTSAEAGALLGIRLGAQKEGRYADPLHIAWVGKKRALTLPLKSSFISDVSRPARIAMAAIIGLVLLSGLLAYTTYNAHTVWKRSTGQLSSAQALLSATQIEHAQELENKMAAGIDFEAIDKATKGFNIIDSQSLKPLVFLDILGKALGPDISLQSLMIEPVKKLNPGDPGYVDPAEQVTIDDGSKPAKPAATEYGIALRIVFPADLDPKIGVTQINELFARLQKAFPDFKMQIVKQVADLSYTGNFVGQSSATNVPQGAQQELEAEIMLWGIIEE